jgi:hypothetical protein
LSFFSGALVVLAQVGCLGDSSGGVEGVEGKGTSAALTFGQQRGEACIQADQDELGSYVLYASSSIGAAPNSHISGGNVGVRAVGSLPSSLTARLYLEHHATVGANYKAVAQSITLNNNAKVGDLFVDDFVEGTNVTHGGIDDFPPTTPIPPVVDPAPVPGGSNLTINAGNNGLELGSSVRNNVTVTNSRILNLTGTSYTFRSLTLAAGAKLNITQPNTVISVLEFIDARQSSSITPVAGLTAKDVILRTTATTTLDNDVEGPGVNLGGLSNVRALVIAPNARLRIGPDAVVTGVVIGRDITLGNNAAVDFEDGIPGEDCQPYDCATLPTDDGNACTVDSCDIELGIQHADRPDGAACTLDGAAEAACLEVVCTELCVEARQTKTGDIYSPEVTPFANPTPAGFYLVDYVQGCMKYNPLWFYSVHATEDGEYTWFLTGSDDPLDQLGQLPGTYGFYPGQSQVPREKAGFQSYDACVAANQNVAPKVIEHTGDGQLGLFLADHPKTDNRIAGNSPTDPAPTWSITPFGACGD